MPTHKPPGPRRSSGAFPNWITDRFAQFLGGRPPDHRRPCRMKPFSVEIHPDALAEAEAARQWYQVRSADAANSFLAELDLGIDSIRTAPELYPRYIRGTRRYLMRRFPYLIVYQLVGQKLARHCRCPLPSQARILENKAGWLAQVGVIPAWPG